MRLRNFKHMSLLLTGVALITWSGEAHAARGDRDASNRGGIDLAPYTSQAPHVKEKTLLRDLVGVSSYKRIINGHAEMEDYGLIEFNLKSKKVSDRDVQALIKYLETLPVPSDQSGDFFITLMSRLDFTYNNAEFLRATNIVNNILKWGDVFHWTEDNKRDALRELAIAEKSLENVKKKYGRSRQFSPMVHKKMTQIEELRESIYGSKSKPSSPDSAVESGEQSTNHSPLESDDDLDMTLGANSTNHSPMLSHDHDDLAEKITDLKSQVRNEIKHIYAADREQLQEELVNMDIISGGESLDNELSHEVTDAEKIAHYETLLARYKGMQPLSASASSRDLDDDLPAPVVHSPVKKLADEDKGVENNPMPLMDEKEPAFIRPILGRESEDEEASLKQNWHSDEAFEARQRAKDLKRRNREAEAQAALQKTVDETEILPQKQLSNHTVEPVNKGLTDEDIKTIHAGHESVSQHVRDLNAALKKLEDSTAFKGLRPSKQKEIQVLVNKIKKGEHKNKGTHHLMALQKDPATHNLHESKARVLEELDADVQALQKVVAKSKNQQLTKALAPVLEAMHGLKTSLTTHNETLGAARSAHEDLDLRYDHQRGETSRDE